MPPSSARLPSVPSAVPVDWHSEMRNGASAAAIFVLPLLLAFSVSGCRGPRQWAEADAGRPVDMRSVMSPMASAGGTSIGPDTGGSVPGDGPAADVPALPPTDPKLRRLSVTVTGPGELTADGQPLACPGTCAIDRPPGTPVTLAAAPAKVADRPVSLFRGWSGPCAGKAGCVVTLDDNKTLTANFHRFVPWEEEVVASARAPHLRLGPVGRDLYVSGEFYNTLSVGRRSFASAGSSDGIVMRYADDGQPHWTKTVVTTGSDFVGSGDSGDVGGGVACFNLGRHRNGRLVRDATGRRWCPSPVPQP